MRTTTGTYGSRKAIAERHELNVCAELRRLGWQVSRTGLGEWMKEAPWLPRAIRELPGTCFLRWFPDMVATNGSRVVFIDAKETSPEHRDSPNYSIEESAIRAARAFSGLAGTAELWFVFGDMRCAFVCDGFAQFCNDSRALPGVTTGRTPFRLLARRWPGFVPMWEAFA